MVNVKGRLRKRDDKGSKRKSGFVYKARDPEATKRRSERKGGRFDSPFKAGFDTWRPQQGDNNIRILPPTWDGFEHFGYTIWVHSWIGPDNSTYLCRYKMLDKKCPICDAAKEARTSGDADEAKALQPKEQVVCWILDRKENQDRPQIWVMSWSQDREVIQQSIDQKTGKVLLIDHDEEGYDLYFRRQGSGLNTRYIGYKFDRDPSPILDDAKEQEEVLQFIQDNPIPDTLIYHDVEHMEKALAGGSVEDKDEDLDEEEGDEDEEETGRRRKAARSKQEEREARQHFKGKRRDEEEDEVEDEDEEDADAIQDEELDQEEEDEKEALSARGRGKRSSRAARDEEDEDEEDEDQPRGRRAKAAKDEEEDEEVDEEENGEDEDEEEDEEEEERVPARRARTTNGKRKVRDEEDEDEEEDERPARRPTRREPTTRRARA